MSSYDQSENARNGKRKRFNRDDDEIFSIQSTCKINDEMTESTRSVAEQRRDRERQRRNEFSETLNDLSEFVFAIDPNDSTIGEFSSSGIKNRRELVQCSTRLLRKLHEENQEKDRVIAKLNLKIKILLNQGEHEKIQQQELEYHQVAAAARLYANENRRRGLHQIEKRYSLPFLPLTTSSTIFDTNMTAVSPSLLAAFTSATQRQVQLPNILSTTDKTDKVFQNLYQYHSLLTGNIMESSNLSQLNDLKPQSI
eukprot:CAMPEP_0194158020 /NCGR_PEP_ID=MMETSP0152-20130528/74314_1 /TAXON_ID=1049557 /ORGANISM="Thalassiothrix antarctica, Strain L6-D1" /LENGTH=253 /DNA_ID=CAMNT_0038866899 /DNA_START=54 /DNA_END=815 /DNA_ORIENTATION=-